MARHLSIELPKHDLRCVARLLEAEAPRTCAAVWAALPLAGDVYHAKYARNELYTFVPPVAELPIGAENPTVTPIPGDVVYFEFSSGALPAATYGYGDGEGAAGRDMVVDLALFYGRNNLLLNGDVGWVPGNVFATIVKGLDQLAAVGNDLWRAGAIGEELRFSRLEAT
ncbi:MAG TPA: DUF3830 family protein [Acidimicrobiales bacterium]|nr:DUF3830 family protein [Acidimicrobiales bacterium]